MTISEYLTMPRSLSGIARQMVRAGERSNAMYDWIYESIHADREREHDRINKHAWKSQQLRRRSIRLLIAEACRSLAQRLAPVMETEERAAESAAQA
jgi:hypothetical protein